MGLRGGTGWGGMGGGGGGEGEFVAADVLFDKKFVRGSDLGGRCSALRGGEAVPLGCLLNLTGAGRAGRKEGGGGGAGSGPGVGINLFNVNPQLGVWGGMGGGGGGRGGQRPPQFVPPQGGRGRGGGRGGGRGRGGE